MMFAEERDLRRRLIHQLVCLPQRLNTHSPPINAQSADIGTASTAHSSIPPSCYLLLSITITSLKVSVIEVQLSRSPINGQHKCQSPLSCSVSCFFPSSLWFLFPSVSRSRCSVLLSDPPVGSSSFSSRCWSFVPSLDSSHPSRPLVPRLCSYSCLPIWPFASFSLLPFLFAPRRLVGLRKCFFYRFPSSSPLASFFVPWCLAPQMDLVTTLVVFCFRFRRFLGLCPLSLDFSVSDSRSISHHLVGS